MSDVIRKFQRHWLLRQYDDNGQVLPENIEVSNAIDALFARAEAAEASLEQTNGIYRISLEKQVICERRAEAAEAALAACRDKTIEECARAADTYIVEGLETVNSVKREIASSIRALKTKEADRG